MSRCGIEIRKNLRLEEFNNVEQRNVKDAGDITRTFAEKIMKAGYQFEEHKVLTEDGYILTAWRIPGKINEEKSHKRKPIVLHHGLLDDSWTFFAFNITRTLPYLLAENNHDIWLPNSRGNIFSTEHIELHNDPRYWNFTWFEMAKYDLKANVEYIKKKTSFDKISWVGHSQGSKQFFTAYTLYPEFIENSIDKFVAIGPVVSVLNSVKNI